MDNKFYIVLGNGSDQVPIIKKLISKKKTPLVIDRELKIKKKKFFFYKSSIYDFNKKKIFSFLKDKKIHNLIYSAAGGSILLYNFISRIKLDNKVNSYLTKCVYSKSYFENILKKRGIQKIQNIMIDKKKLILKPDSPIEGKKFIKQVSLNLKKSLQKKVKKSISHNQKTHIQKKIRGDDISFIFFKDYKTKKIENLLKIQEFNRFNEENNLIHLGICSPPIINISKTLVNKINSQIKKLRFILDNYYGVFGITFKLYKDLIYMYEINIGLPGDEITKSFFPYFYKKNLYDLEINNKSIDFKIQKKKNKLFFGILKKKKILYKKKFIKQIQTYSDEI